MIRLIFVFGLFFCFAWNGFAQPYPLPLSFQGEGSTQTASFTATGPWKAEMTSTELGLIRVFTTQGQDLGPLLNNEMVETAGEFFLSIETTGSWTLSINPALDNPQNAVAATAEASGKTQTPISVDLPLKRYGYQITRFVRPAPSGIADTKDCSDFATVFEAHDAFMAAGGPELDPFNLDPDGDGYVCTYDPRESYTPPISCEAGTAWQNPRYRVKDGIYARGACRPTN